MSKIVEDFRTRLLLRNIQLLQRLAVRCLLKRCAKVGHLVVLRRVRVPLGLRQRALREYRLDFLRWHRLSGASCVVRRRGGVLPRISVLVDRAARFSWLYQPLAASFETFSRFDEAGRDVVLVGQALSDALRGVHRVMHGPACMRLDQTLVVLHNSLPQRLVLGGLLLTCLSWPTCRNVQGQRIRWRPVALEALLLLLILHRSLKNLL